MKLFRVSSYPSIYERITDCLLYVSGIVLTDARDTMGNNKTLPCSAHIPVD